MGSLASINVKFSADLKQFSSEMQNALREIDKAGEKFKQIGTSLSTYVTLPILAAGAAAVKFASDYQESLNKVDVAFKGSSDQVKEFAKTSLENFGIAEGTALDLAAAYGDMGTSMGLSTKEAAKMSTELVGLAGDLSSFKNIGIDQANTALSAIFTGETESLKKLGIVMTETNLQYYASSQGIKTQIKDMDQATKVNLRYQYVLSVTKNAQGDFARTSGGAANQMRIFQESLKQVAQQFGSIILPVFTQVVHYVNELIAGFGKLSEGAKTTIVVVAAIAAAIGPLILALGTVMTLLPAIMAGFAALTGPIGLTVLAVGALVAVIVTKWKPIKQILVDTANYFIDLYNSSTVFRIAVEDIILIFKNLWTEVKFIFNSMMALGQYVARNIFNYFSTLGKLIKAVLTFDLSGVKKALVDGFSSGVGSAKTLFKDIKKESITAGKEVGSNISTAINNAFSKGKISKIKISKESVDSKGVEQSVEDGVVAGAGKGAGKIGKVLTEGTIAFYEDQISLLKKQQQEVAKTEAQYYLLGNAIAEIQSKINKIAVSTLEPINLQAVGKTTDSTKIGPDFEKMKVEMKAKADGLIAVAESTKVAMLDISQSISEAVSDLAVNAAVGIGEAIGALASGTASMGDVMRSMLSMVGSFMESLGKSLIQAGIAGIAFKKLLANPYAAIAAGIALVALGAVVENKFKEGPKFADGGIVGGSSFYGDKILARVNSGEMVTNSAQQQKIWGAMQGGSSGGVFIPDVKIKGNDIWLSFKRTEELKNRIG
jgi:hypothetical protein